MITKEQLDFYREWSKDLRSGQFTQCKDRLYDGTGHCCLGVACRTAQRLGMPMKDSVTFTGKFCFRFDNSEETYDIPCLFKDRINFHEFQRYGKPYDPSTIWFATLNDKENYTFEQIADVIDARIKELEETCI